MNIGPTLSYNPFWLQKSSEVLHQMHPRLENTINYCSEFQGEPIIAESEAGTMQHSRSLSTKEAFAVPHARTSTLPYVS